MKYFLYCLQHYADFDGRARRSEYWFFQLFNFLITIGIYLIVLAIKGVTGVNLGFLSTVYSIAVIIPNLAVSARRLHDTNRSGWCMGHRTKRIIEDMREPPITIEK